MRDYKNVQVVEESAVNMVVETAVFVGVVVMIFLIGVVL